MNTKRAVTWLLPCVLGTLLAGCSGNVDQATSAPTPDKYALQEALKTHFLQTTPQQVTYDLQVTFSKNIGNDTYATAYLFHDEKQMPHFGNAYLHVSSEKGHPLQFTGSSEGAPLDLTQKYSFISSTSNGDEGLGNIPCQFIGGIVNDRSITEIVVLYDDGKTVDAKVDPTTHTFAALRTDPSQKSPEPKATFAVDANWKEVAHTPPFPPAP